MYYRVTDMELRRIASAIRARKGLNLYDPVARIACVKPSTKYKYSKYVVFDGTHNEYGGCDYNDADGEYITTQVWTIMETPQAGEQRVSNTVTTPSNCAYISNYANTAGMTESKIQVELGKTLTDYNAFQPLEFPDDFISEISSIE